MDVKSFLLKKQKALLNQLKSVGPFVDGSLSVVNRICGTKTCSCMKGGKKHPAMFLTWKEKRKTMALYIPVSMYNDVKLWNKNYKKLKMLIKKISSVQKELLKLR